MDTRNDSSIHAAGPGAAIAHRAPRGQMLTAVLLAGAVAMTTALVGASPASAAEQDGWLRVGHLSPDTKSVDVQLTALAGGDVVYELDDVAYGQVSDYTELDAGTYVVSMVPAGSKDGTEPVISASVDVEAGQPSTVAAYGTYDDLQTAVFADDLSSPDSGEARIRLVQAATVADTVDVSTSEGTEIVNDAKYGTATDYASVDAGSWTLELEGDGVDGSTDVDLENGSVNTLFVLDNSDGGLSVVPVVDSASSGDMPKKGVQTGGGGTAGTHESDAADAAPNGPFAQFVSWLDSIL